MTAKVFFQEAAALVGLFVTLYLWAVVAMALNS